MAARKKRGVKPGTKRGPYKTEAADTEQLLSMANINDILDKRLQLRNEIKARVKKLNQLLKRI